jgi:Nuclease A inhibitor-like protein
MKRSGEKETLEDRIAEACRGLSYMSETDAPVEPFIGGKADEISKDVILTAAGSDPKVHSEEADPAEFFDRLTAINDWYTAAQKRNVRRFAALEKLLRENLTDLHVYRTGRIRIAIYVVGLDADKNILGVKTMAVET